MAIFHMTMKVCRTSAAAKIDYIFRQGKYSYSTKSEDLLVYGYENLPSWAKDAKDFFKEMDRQELSKEEKAALDRQDEPSNLPSNQRKVKCREIEFSLPSELNKEENLELAEKFIQEIMGDNHVYSWAWHINKGALSGKDNPHVHLVFSDRLIEKDRDVERELFCRQRSGYKKDPRMNGSKRAEWYQGVRERWAEMVNQYLERKGLDERISHKSYKEQGIDKIPQIHLGHKAVHAIGLGAAQPRFDKFKEIVEANHRRDGEQIAQQEIKKVKPSYWERFTSLVAMYGYENTPEEKEAYKDVVKGRKTLQEEILDCERTKSSKNAKNSIQAILRNSKASLERKQYWSKAKLEQERLDREMAAWDEKQKYERPFKVLKTLENLYNLHVEINLEEERMWYLKDIGKINEPQAQQEKMRTLERVYKIADALGFEEDKRMCLQFMGKDIDSQVITELSPSKPLPQVKEHKEQDDVERRRIKREQRRRLEEQNKDQGMSR